MSIYTGLGNAPTDSGLPPGGAPGDVLVLGPGGQPAWGPPSGGGAAANPTALVGLTAVNGAATTLMRSDGAPALSQAIAPTWTGLHTFSAGAAGPFATFVDASQPTYSKPNFRRINAATAPFTSSTVGVGLAFDYTGGAAAGIYISNGGAFILETLGGGGAMRLNSPTVRLENELSAAPSPRTLLIGGSSRAGTDSNIGGANGTIQSGLGTGTGTVSSLVFQTPTTVGAGSGVQTYATRMIVNVLGVQLPDGSVTAPSINFVSSAGTGMYVSSGQLAFSTSGTLRGYFATNGHFTIPSGNVAISGGSVVSGIANFMHQTSIALNNGAAAAAGTLTNAPVAGNPTKWIPINDGGTTRYIPAW